MRRSLLMLGALVLSMGGAVIIACSGGSSDSGTTDGDGGDEASDPGQNTDGGPLGNAGTGQATGLPCDVQALLENRCLACHDGSMVLAPPLSNYNDLITKSKADPSKSMAQQTLVRMQSATSPMPPKPAAPPDPDEIAAMAAWVNAGTPENKMSCTTAPPPTPEGGTISDGGTMSDGGDAGSGCTSGTFWDAGNTKSPLMNPGEACNACHQVLGGPNLQFAGTVYKTAHEPDKCNGQAPPPPITVSITDVNKKTVTATVDTAGNFNIPKQGGAPLKAPFTAKLTAGAASRAMVGTVTSGDCNSCHSVAGKNGAPGRILSP